MKSIRENSDMMKTIKTIVWIASIVAAIILWYTNDTSAKYVDKNVYDVEKTANKELMKSEFDNLKQHITQESSGVSKKIDSLENDVKALDGSVERLRLEQVELKAQQNRYLRR